MHGALPRLLSLALLLGAASLTAQTPCGTWTVIDVPYDSGWNRALFEDVAVLPDGSTFAVGYAQLPTPPFGPENVTLAMHSDGTSWTHTPTPYVAAWVGGANDFLHAVAAIAADDVWAAGERHGDAGGLSVGAWLHVLHWDGSDWTEMPVPEPPGGAGINFSGTRVYDIVAFGSDDVWFGGMWAHPNELAAVTWRPLAMHWDGSGMTVFDTPVLFSGGNFVHMRQMAAHGPDDIWGICRTNTASGLTTQPMLIHYDGSDWSQVSTPSLGQAVVLDDIVATGDDEIWVVGHTYSPVTPFALHWDGSGWTVHWEAPFATTAAALALDALYLGTNTITLFDGDSSVVVEDFPGVDSPSVLGLEPGDGCTLWAVGRLFGNPVTGDLAPFAAVMTSGDAGPWTTLGGGTPGMAGTPALAGDGPLTEGSTLTLTLSSAPPQHLALLWIALSSQPVDVLGGTLHAFPYDHEILLGTDGSGGFLGAMTWPPAVPAGTSLWFQFLVADPTVPAGITLSGAVRGTTP